MPPHDEHDAGPDERELYDEGVEVRGALDDGVAQDVVLELEALQPALLVLADALGQHGAVAVVVHGLQLKVLRVYIDCRKHSCFMKVCFVHDFITLRMMSYITVDAYCMGKLKTKKN